MTFGCNRCGWLGFFLGDQRREWFLAEQIFAQVGIERRVVPAQPFEHHRGVLFLLVAVMREDRLQFVIIARRDG